MVSLEPDGHHPGGGTCWTDNKLFIETFVATILGIVAFKRFYFSKLNIKRSTAFQGLRAGRLKEQRLSTILAEWEKKYLMEVEKHECVCKRREGPR